MARHNAALRPLFDAEVAAYIRWASAGGAGPSQREIAQALGLGAQTVANALRRLEARGVVRRLPGKARALEVCGPLPMSMSNALLYVFQQIDSIRRVQPEEMKR